MELHISYLRNCMQYIIFHKVDVPGPLLGRGPMWFDSCKRPPPVSDQARLTNVACSWIQDSWKNGSKKIIVSFFVRILVRFVWFHFLFFVCYFFVEFLVRFHVRFFCRISSPRFLQVYERVGVPVVEVYERVWKSIISLKGPKGQQTRFRDVKPERD